MEFTVGENFPALNTCLKDLHIKNNILVGGIVRGEEYVLPTGSSCLEVGDKVIVVTAVKSITELTQILK